MDENNERQPREPKNMQGLLRYAIEQAENSDNGAVTSAALQPIDDERRQWFHQVLSSMSVNVAAIMKRSIETLTKTVRNDESVPEKIEALDELMDWVDNMDFANDFYRIGGFSVLKPCLRSENETIRSKTAELIAELVQNNPFCQEGAIESHLIADLVELLDKDDCGTVRIKALYSLSSLVRGQPAAQKEFSDCDGFSVLLRSMQSDEEKLKVKASFLVSALCVEQPLLKDVLFKMGFIEQLVSLIQREHDLTHEHLIGALVALVGNNEAAIEECRRPELNLRETLAQRIELVRGKDEFKEELDYCQKLLDLCFASNENQDR